MKKILIISHKDADGITSFVSYMWNYLEEKNLSKNTKNILKHSDYIDFEYSNDILKVFKRKKINFKNYDKVVLLDLTLPLEVMELLYKKFKKNFIWIDHHKRPDKELENKLYLKKIKIEGIRNHNFSACYLVWKHFKKEPPDFVKYIQDMDLWKFEMDESRNFTAGLPDLKEKYNTKNIKFILDMFDFDYYNKNKIKIIERGKIITKHQEEFVLRTVFYGKIINFHGKKAFIINTNFFSSTFADFFFKIKDKKFKNVDILIVWNKDYNDKRFIFSLRKRKEKKIDLSKIAKEYGGGGHFDAAGFNLDSLAKLKYS